MSPVEFGFGVGMVVRFFLNSSTGLPAAVEEGGHELSRGIYGKYKKAARQVVSSLLLYLLRLRFRPI
jgi:hypothetical protein